MNALYIIRYTGQISGGSGVLYIGKNVVTGVDEGNIRYMGKYTEHAGRLDIEVTLSTKADSGMLVTGATLPQGQTLQITANLPLDLDDGQSHKIYLSGQPVNVAFEKISDLP